MTPTDLKEARRQLGYFTKAEETKMTRIEIETRLTNMKVGYAGAINFRAVWRISAKLYKVEGKDMQLADAIEYLMAQ